MVGGLGNDLYDAVRDGRRDGGRGDRHAGVARPTGGGHTREAPLLAHKRVPLVVGYLLVLCHRRCVRSAAGNASACYARVETPPIVAEYVTTHSLMLLARWRPLA